MFDFELYEELFAKDREKNIFNAVEIKNTNETITDGEVDVAISTGAEIENVEKARQTETVTEQTETVIIE